MLAKKLLKHTLSLFLALCLLPLSGFTQSGGWAASDSLAYDTALTMLINSSKTDVDKLEDIRKQLKQAGTYQLGVEYRIAEERVYGVDDIDYTVHPALWVDLSSDIFTSL